MISLLLLVSLMGDPQLAPCTTDDPCDSNDVPRLIVTLATEKERADKAVQIGDLEHSARVAAEKLVEIQSQRVEDWKQVATKEAYRPWYTSPGFLYGSGIATGIILSVAIVVAAHH